MWFFLYEVYFEYLPKSFWWFIEKISFSFIFFNVFSYLSTFIKKVGTLIKYIFIFLWRVLKSIYKTFKTYKPYFIYYYKLIYKFYLKRYYFFFRYQYKKVDILNYFNSIISDLCLIFYNIKNYINYIFSIKELYYLRKLYNYPLLKRKISQKTNVLVHNPDNNFLYQQLTCFLYCWYNYLFFSRLTYKNSANYIFFVVFIIISIIKNSVLFFLLWIFILFGLFSVYYFLLNFDIKVINIYINRVIYTYKLRDFKVIVLSNFPAMLKNTILGYSIAKIFSSELIKDIIENKERFSIFWEVYLKNYKSKFKNLDFKLDCFFINEWYGFFFKEMNELLKNWGYNSFSESKKRKINIKNQIKYLINIYVYFCCSVAFIRKYISRLIRSLFWSPR